MEYKDTNTMNLGTNQMVTYTREEEYAKHSWRSLIEVIILREKARNILGDINLCT